MATRPSSKSATSNANNSDFKKADAFLNVRLKASNGKSYAVGSSGIPLHLNNKADKALIEKYDADPSAVEKLNTGLLIYSYTRIDNSVETEETEFDL